MSQVWKKKLIKCRREPLGARTASHEEVLERAEYDRNHNHAALALEQSDVYSTQYYVALVRLCVIRVRGQNGCWPEP